MVSSADLVFTVVGRQGIEGMTHNQASHDWKAVREAAGVTGARLHDLRHFAATTMVSAGVPLTDVSAILGHGKTSTTADIYAHAKPGHGRAAIEEIEKALARK